jgi:hypothetical protein
MKKCQSQKAERQAEIVESDCVTAAGKQTGEALRAEGDSSFAETKAELEANLAKANKQRRDDHVAYIRQFRFHRSKTFMDYLHGDVKLQEAPIACLYEYLRESKWLRVAATRRDEIVQKRFFGHSDDQCATWEGLSFEERAKRVEEAARSAVQELIIEADYTSNAVFEFNASEPKVEVWSMPQRHDAALFLDCECFPGKDWNELSPAERDGILRFYETRKWPPLHAPNLKLLKAKGFSLDSFDLKEEKSPLAMLHLFGPYHVFVSSLDLSQTETHLVEQFRATLQQSDFQELLRQYKKPKSKSAAKALDRIKDLAAWRLYRENNRLWSFANKFANDHRKPHNPFRAAKQQSSKQQPGTKTPANAADLFANEDDAYEVQERAWRFLRELLPEEFDSSVPPQDIASGLNLAAEKE